MTARNLGKALTTLARRAIESQLGMSSTTFPEEEEHPLFREHRGLFVTLKIAGQLRGCIGSLIAQETVRAGVQHQACNAAFHDHRFAPVTAEELERISISISVLTQPQELKFTNAEELMRLLEPHRDGVILQHPSGRSATYLPQVWQQLPRVKDFLSSLASKAGLPQESWRDAGVRVSTYRAEIYDEE